MAEITFTRRAYGHLERITRYDRNVILDAVKEQLTYAPHQEMRHRKLLRATRLADWELRVSRYRVFYDVDVVQRVVWVLAVGIKERDRLIIAGKEVDL